MRRTLILMLAGVAGFSVALVAGIAGAKSFTLSLAKNAKVSGPSETARHESIAVTGHGLAVYWLSGDSASHPKCTAANQCFRFWPPVKVKSAKGLSKAPGIAGKLGTWHHDGFIQLTLSGHPLYTFSGDMHPAVATGDGISGFGGTWHVASQGSASSGPGGTTTGTTGTTETTTTPTDTTPTGTTTTMPTTTTTTTPTTCGYPPYC